MAPTKTAQAPAKKAVAKKAAPPAIDLTKLSVVDGPAPSRNVGVSAADNPFVRPVRDSWSKKVQMSPPQGGNPATYKGSGKKVESVPNANVTQVENLIRAAALAVERETGDRLGVTIAREDLKNGTTNILFAAKTRKAARKAAAATPAPSA